MDTKETGTFIGIDVSKETLDVAVDREADAQQYANDAVGIAALTTWIAVKEVTLVVVEASGGGN